MYSGSLTCSPAQAMTLPFPMTQIHLVMMFSLLCEDTWMSTRPLLHSKLGGILGLSLLFRMQRISASQACTVPASWLIQCLASTRCRSVMAVHHRTVKMRPYVTVHM